MMLLEIGGRTMKAQLLIKIPGSKYLRLVIKVNIIIKYCLPVDEKLQVHLIDCNWFIVDHEIIE